MYMYISMYIYMYNMYIYMYKFTELRIKYLHIKWVVEVDDL